MTRNSCKFNRSGVFQRSTSNLSGISRQNVTKLINQLIRLGSHQLLGDFHLPSGNFTGKRAVLWHHATCSCLVLNSWILRVASSFQSYL
jgi:hypothetical protein